MAKVQLGDRVQYTDGQGFQKLALVIGTRKTVQKGTDLPRPEKGTAHLLVISGTGNTYTRHGVPFGDGPRTFTSVGKAEVGATE